MHYANTYVHTHANIYIYMYMYITYIHACIYGLSTAPTNTHKMFETCITLQI